MKGKIKRLISSYTGHSNVALTERGNTAIKHALSLVDSSEKKNVLIPDSGGWYGYKKIIKKLGLTAVEIPTDDSLIRLDKISEYINDACAILYANPGGYFADQDIRKIYEIGNARIAVILDVSGCISDPILCDGKYADMMVGSFGKWKIVDAEAGGFLSAKNSFGIKDNIDDMFLPRIHEKLKGAPMRLKALYNECAIVKRDLEEFSIIHKNRKGINVVVAFEIQDEKERIIDYCNKNSYEYVLCPNYIKVQRDAVSIEVKRLTSFSRSL